MRLDQWWVYAIWFYGGFVVGWTLYHIMAEARKRTHSVGEEVEEWLKREVNE
jgi:hypothetical protein